MNKRILIFGVALIFLLGAILLYWIQSSEQSTVGGIRSTDWNIRYGIDSKAPNGLYFFSGLLKQEKKPKNLIEIPFESGFKPKKIGDTQALYVLIGDTVTLKPQHLKFILKQVKDKGAGLILMSCATYRWFYDEIGLRGHLEYSYNDVIPLTHQNTSYQLYHLHEADTIFGQTFGLSACNKPPLLTSENLTVAIKFSYGNGEILIGFNPNTIVNYQFLNPAGLKHAKLLIQCLKDYKHVYFLSYATLHWREEMDWTVEEPKEDNSLLKLINDQASLRNASYALLIGLLLLAFFAGKRKRAILSLPEPESRLTDNYVNTVASIYQTHESPSVAFQLVRNQFYHAIQRAYFSDIQKMDKTDGIQFLQEKTNLETAFLSEILTCISAPIEQVDMSHVYRSAGLCHEFFLRAGIIKNSQSVHFPLKIHRHLGYSFAILLLGACLQFIGLYNAVHSVSVGPGLAFIGTLVLAYGILRLRVPYLEIHAMDNIVFNPLIGQKKTVQLQLDATGTKCIILHKEQAIDIPTWDVINREYIELITLIKRL